MSKIFESEEIKNSLQSLEEGMVDYLEYEEEGDDYKPSYTKEDIKTTMNFMKEFLDKINNSKSKEEALNIVKYYVLKLNKLNEKCEYEIFETDQREEICGTIIFATFLKGFNPEKEDITEEWREF